MFLTPKNRRIPPFSCEMAGFLVFANQLQIARQQRKLRYQTLLTVRSTRFDLRMVTREKHLRDRQRVVLPL